ncbi:MAG: hypothetical protein KKH28_05740 [Elusimicrobia bacterium]|nr:hypothetical protein [Elusimicrobiota bacterium]
MELKSAILTLALGLFACAACSAQDNPFANYQENQAAYSDPSFQDFIETSYGYLQPAKKPALRDAVADKAPRQIFITILPKDPDYAGLVKEITASAGFVLYGEQTIHSKSGKTIQLLGWARADRLVKIFQNPGAVKVYIGRHI